MARKSSKGNKTLSERISVSIARKPEQSVLVLILLFNLAFFMIAAFIISRLAPDTLSARGFWPSVFYTVTMILDAGCISFVVEDVGQTGLTVIIICLLIVLIGMITFTGAVIGYITNYISSFIENANNGKRKLKISNHTVILNWNTRGAEIIADYLYTDQTEDVVVLVDHDRDTIQQEIDNRIEGILKHENDLLLQHVKDEKLGPVATWNYLHNNRIVRAVSVIVREGDVLSTAQLSDICIEKAQTIIILGHDYQDAHNKYDFQQDDGQKKARGNSNLIKSLILVAEMTSRDDSFDNQRIVVEVEDDWTEEMVNQVIAHKERLGKCEITPIPVNRNLGKIMSQLAVMPELNRIYSELFSNKGFYFTSRPMKQDFRTLDAKAWMGEYIRTHSKALPMSIMNTRTGTTCFYLSGQDGDVDEPDNRSCQPVSVHLNPDFCLHKKNVIILGHNSGMNSLMDGFNAFRNEWSLPDGSEILNLIIIDEQKSLERHNFYREYPYVSKVIASDVYDKKIIYDAFAEIGYGLEGDVSILILSDDQMPNDDVDEEPLTYLMYIDDMMQKRQKEDPSFSPADVDVIIEILDPQNYEAVSSFNPKHVVISNQYISHMMTQIGEHESISEFYNDILTYDPPETENYNSKELYIKVAGELLTEMPAKCTAHELVHALYEACPAENQMVLLGYFRGDEYTIFAGENADMEIELQPADKLIMCSDH